MNKSVKTILFLFITAVTFSYPAGAELLFVETLQYQKNFADGNKAPDFELITLDGKIIKLSDYKGKIVLLDFWATWCGPCRMAIPELVELQNEYKDNVVVIGISLDQSYTQQNLKSFIQQYGINYPVVIGTIEVVEAYGNIRAIPTTFIISQDGDLVKRFTGYVPESYYVSEIIKLMQSSK